MLNSLIFALDVEAAFITVTTIESGYHKFNLTPVLFVVEQFDITLKIKHKVNADEEVIKIRYSYTVFKRQ